MAEDNTPTNVADDITELENNIRSKYSDYLEKDIIQEYYASDPNKPGILDTPFYKKRGISLSYFEGDISREFPYNKNTLFIENLYIDETQRGQGIGSQIFDEIKQFADDNGLYIRLFNDENFNTTFWEKKGFGIYEQPRNPNRSWERTLPNYVLAPEGETLPVTPKRLDTPTNVVDEGIELYHSISKGETVNKNFHAGTYNAALDRASQFYGGEQLYKIAKDNLDFIQDQANDLVSELSEQVSFEKVENFYEVTDGMVTREITITLPTGVEANFNIVAETFNSDLTVRFQDLDGYDGAEIYSETLLDIEYEPDNLKSVTSTIDIIDEENVAEGLLDEIGLKSQAGDFNYKDGYDLYKVNIKPDANVVNIPDTAIFVEFGIEKEMSSDFIQGFIERPKTVNQFTNVTQIKISGKTYDITDTFTSAQALQEHFKNADVLVYTNDIEDVGSKSYMFLNENSYVLEKIDDTQFNIDVANKYIKNNPYETISKLARRESFTEPERYQVLLNPLLDETDTPTNVVDDVVIAKDDFGKNVTVPLDENGNVILYRATDNPEKLKITNFTKQGDIRSAGLGRNTYFTTNADYSFQYAINRNNIDNFKYTTNIKPNEILNLNTKISDNIELAKTLGVPEEFWVFEWRRLFDDKIANRMGFASGTREFFNKNINTLIENGYKAVGTSETGTGVMQPYAQYEIVPLITENNNYNIKPISKLTQEKEINGLGVYNETPLDTLTNVVDDVQKLESKLLEKYADVLEFDESVLGDLDNKSPLSLNYYEGKLNLDVISVSPAYQNQGIGRSIMNDIIEFANANNLEIRVDSLADEFFVKMGFENFTNEQGIVDEAIFRKLPDTPDRPLGPGAAYINEILNANTQLVDELPLSQTVKNRFDNLIRTRARNLATPGGAIDAVDIWELAVTGLMITTIALSEIDEIPTIFKRTATNMFNSMTAPYNIPPVPLEEYDLNYEFINKVLTTGEKVMPTDIIIKKVGDVVKGAAETGAVTGFGYVPPNLTKTDTIETTQKIQPGVQEEKMFEQAKPKKSKATGGAGAKIL
mgnify:FL=1